MTASDDGIRSLLVSTGSELWDATNDKRPSENKKTELIRGRLGNCSTRTWRLPWPTRQDGLCARPIQKREMRRHFVDWEMQLLGENLNLSLAGGISRPIRPVCR